MSGIRCGSAEAWAVENFWSAPLHAARRAQVVKVARLALLKPSGTVAGTSRVDAERQSIYGFLEGAVDHRVLVKAACDATADRCIGYPFVFVPIDGSSIAVTDRAASKGTGRVGSPPAQGRGLKTMSALALSPRGTALGVAALEFWARGKKRTRDHQAVPIERRESYKWIEIASEVHERFCERAPDCAPWFQLDREGDFAEMLLLATQKRMLLTVRARCDRRLRGGGRLKARLMRRAPLGRYELRVPARHGHPARVARIDVRACEVQLEAVEKPSKKRHTVSMTAVLAREVGHVRGSARIEWMLLTTQTVDSFAMARLVINGYAHRWSIEEFFRTWKSGVCGVESMQLRSFGAMAKWATILGVAATRAMYLAEIAREKPDAPASEAFTEDDLEALVVLRKPKGVEVGDPITIRQAVRWVADLGGYVGNKNSGEPGKITIGRGLLDLQVAVLAIAAYKKSKRSGAKRPAKS
jgi:hypothetical protein